MFLIPQVICLPEVFLFLWIAFATEFCPAPCWWSDRTKQQSGKDARTGMCQTESKHTFNCILYSLIFLPNSAVQPLYSEINKPADYPKSGFLPATHTHKIYLVLRSHPLGLCTCLNVSHCSLYAAC